MSLPPPGSAPEAAPESTPETALQALRAEDGVARANRPLDALDARGRLVGRPAERYGDDSRWRGRVGVVAAALVALVLLAWAGWEAVDQGTGVSYTDQAYRVVDASTVQVTFTVSKPAGARVRCRVQALSSGAAQVGLTVVTVGAKAPRNTTQTTVVRTQQLAVTGTVESCTRS